MEIVKPELYPAGVLWVLDAIDGDGAAALDADMLIGGGIPLSFLAPLIETIRAGDLSEVERLVAGSDTRLSSIWSLDLLRALAAHYRLIQPVFYVGHSRNARVLSEIIRAHLEQRSPRVEAWQ